MTERQHIPLTEEPIASLIRELQAHKIFNYDEAKLQDHEYRTFCWKLVDAAKKPVATPDMVNHPPHYKTESGLEAITVRESFFPANPHIWTAVKYLLRASKKGNERQDLEKAIWYIQRYIRTVLK